ncbi:NAD(P)-dependent dehydrogenase, short-chain alcohol dehydrogenase family [Enhydrobacter aerosaccus]|uniref:NAD(P)-dependent dehydrogenase, short-chain alcohol dehydrogenase family n=1 Tax=Enhydrobacter aerosaccus TaxID=225324 RepID=A0A1T4RZ84_9HYPH|nr:SDR family oxidoreductase [Enhydrobacter aerosaccus]SKA21255.1 NAD(P)-dependent dehydrogenase, short-chain alcohol dehydrogenase family [Enhydrobacter aerosaccus]
MSDRVALVTGSTQGIGAAIARRLAKEGYRVALHGRRSASEMASLLTGLPGASYHAADLEQVESAGSLVRDVLAHHGRLDVLVNNAGAVARFPHADLKAATPAVWRRMMDVNLIAPWMLITEAETALRASARTGRPGCIVNIGTHAGVRPKGSSIPYAVSKAALHHTTRLLALTLGPDIRVNCVAPGLVDTAMSTGWEAAYELWNTKSPMRRPAKPDDIADLVAAFCRNDYVTGEILIADGGLNLT